MPKKKEFIKLGEGIINRQHITIRELAQLIVDAKKKEFIKLGEGIINRQHITIRELAQLIVDVVVTCKAVLTGPLYYRDMKTLKIAKLKKNKPKFNAIITIFMQQSDPHYVR